MGSTGAPVLKVLRNANAPLGVVTSRQPFHAAMRIGYPFVTRRVECVHRCPKNCTHCHRSIRRIIQTSGHSWVEDQWPSRRAATLSNRPREERLIDFLAQMPTGTMILLTIAVLGLAATLIVLRW